MPGLRPAARRPSSRVANWDFAKRSLANATRFVLNLMQPEREVIPMHGDSSEQKCEPIDLERLHRKQRLAASFRLFSHFGFEQGTAGHITSRDPARTDAFWVNPYGRHFGLIRVSDLILVDHAGAVLEGEGRINPAAFAIHSAIHASRPEVIAAAHAHSVFGKAWSTTGRLLDPITQDACVFYADHAVFKRFGGVVDSTEEASLLVEALGSYKAVVLANHGLLTVGTSVDSAAWWFITLERCCHVQLLAEAAGTPSVIADIIADRTCKMFGTETAGYRSFQPLYEYITRKEPDLLC